jgi:hypothetical protein
MVSDPLVIASDMDGFPGAPFPANVLDSAAGQIRDECGWHIAPTVTETVTLATGGGRVVLLPSLNVSTVVSVTDDGGVALDGWKVTPNGVIRRSSNWPEVIVVQFTHGFPSCPASLKAVIAERAKDIRDAGRVKAESLASRSVALDLGSSRSESVLAKYTLPGRP